jgi:hypothetical protein
MPMEKTEYDIDVSTDDSQDAKPPSGPFSVFEDEDEDAGIAPAGKPATAASGEDENENEIEVVADDEGTANAAPSDADGADDAVSEEEMAGYSERVKKRIKQMTLKQRTAERKAAEFARENAVAVEVLRRQQEKLKELSALIKNGEAQYVSAATAAHEGSVAAARTALQSAMEEGDPAKIADAQVALTVAVSQLQQAKSYQPVAPKVEQDIEAFTQPVSRPAEVDADAFEPDPAAKAWMGKNKWFVKPADTTERLMRNMAIEYANTLESQGYDPIADADAYYAEINKLMRQRFPEKFPGARPAATQSRSAPSAGAGQSAPAGQPAKQKIKITESQARIARKMGIPLAEYAKEYARMYGTS